MIVSRIFTYGKFQLRGYSFYPVLWIACGAVGFGIGLLIDR